MVSNTPSTKIFSLSFSSTQCQKIFLQWIIDKLAISLLNFTTLIAVYYAPSFIVMPCLPQKKVYYCVISRQSHRQQQLKLQISTAEAQIWKTFAFLWNPLNPLPTNKYAVWIYISANKLWYPVYKYMHNKAYV